MARWRAAEALVEAGDREHAAEQAIAALSSAQRLGSHWLAREILTLAERGRRASSHFKRAGLPRSDLRRCRPALRFFCERFSNTPSGRNTIADFVASYKSIDTSPVGQTGV